MSAGLSGTGRLADDLYLMAHHEVTGKPFVQPRALGTGLAGGLLAELMLGASISLRPDGAVLPGRTWSGDELARHVRDLIAAEREPHPVGEWLLFLARTAANDVAGRLERSGYLTQAGRRSPARITCPVGGRRCGRCGVSLASNGNTGGPHLPDARPRRRRVPGYVQQETRNSEHQALMLTLDGALARRAEAADEPDLGRG